MVMYMAHLNKYSNALLNQNLVLLLEPLLNHWFGTIDRLI